MAAEMRFHAVVGNPPYQSGNDASEGTRSRCVYDRFMDAAEAVSDRVEFITPARFLFDAGGTPRAWNRRKLSDPHFKVVRYDADASQVFPGTSIPGGVAVTMHDRTRTCKPVGTFIPLRTMRAITGKVTSADGFESMDGIVDTSYSYRFTERMHQDHPDAADRLSRGHEHDLTSTVLKRLPDIFHETPPDDGCEYVAIWGRLHGRRACRHIRSDYVNDPGDLRKWKVLIPKSNGSPPVGTAPTTVIGRPMLAAPMVGHTETFMSLGRFDSREEAEALLSYVETKFARTMLGVLKTTQSNHPGTWRFVPMQNFTPDSDIDWSLPVPMIDRELYGKYHLNRHEQDFIESAVKPMTDVRERRQSNQRI